MKHLQNSISNRINELNATIPSSVRLIAISKYHSTEDIIEAYDAGQRVFGESRAQELMAKIDSLKDYTDIQWHFIGSLQKNKVKYIAPFISLIHSVDSLSLLAEIDKQAKKHNRVIDILLELHIAQEDTKNGMTKDELFSLLSELKSNQIYQNISIRGLMTMATYTEDTKLIRSEFASAKAIFEQIKSEKLVNDIDKFDTLSMGMSGDFKIAIEEGANMIRLGSIIFGERTI